MISSSAKKFLNCLCKLSDYSEAELYLDRDAFRVYNNDVDCSPYDCSKYRREINSIFSAFIDDGYIEWAGGNGPFFRLTHKGLHAKDFERQEFKKFLYQSILVPIIVSVITTLITLAINWLIRWLPSLL